MGGEHRLGDVAAEAVGDEPDVVGVDPGVLEQGTADPVVPWHASVVAAHELTASGATVQLRLIPGAGHDLDRPDWTVPLEDGTTFLLKNV